PLLHYSFSRLHLKIASLLQRHLLQYSLPHSPVFCLPPISSLFPYTTLFRSPLSVARTLLIGVFDPTDLLKISVIPANSNTARTGPPAITPVPGAAGFINTLPELNCPVIV